MLHANIIVLYFMEPELLPTEVSYSENRDFRPFCSCDFDLDSMTFIYELDPYFLKICKYGCANINFLRQGFRKSSSDRQTDRQTDIIYYVASRVVKKMSIDLQMPRNR